MIDWNNVTKYSKLCAIVFFVGILPVWSFYIGKQVADTKSTQDMQLSCFSPVIKIYSASKECLQVENETPHASSTGMVHEIQL